MKYEICIKYPSGYRYHKQIEACTTGEANKVAEELKAHCDNIGFSGHDVCKIEYVRNESELKPCPFCGGEAEIGYYEDKHYVVHCGKCYKSVHYIDDSKQHAIKAWNKRAE